MSYIVILMSFQMQISLGGVGKLSEGVENSRGCAPPAPKENPSMIVLFSNRNWIFLTILGPFAIDWCQWGRQDHTLSFCGLDEWIECFPDQGKRTNEIFLLGTKQNKNIFKQ